MAIQKKPYTFANMTIKEKTLASIQSEIEALLESKEYFSKLPDAVFERIIQNGATPTLFKIPKESRKDSPVKENEIDQNEHGWKRRAVETVIKEQERPLKKNQIRQYLKKKNIDIDAPNGNGLTYALIGLLKSERLVKCNKPTGLRFKGELYAFPEWVDKAGNIKEKFLKRILYE